MSEEINETINREEVKSFHNYFHFSKSLDPNIETVSLKEDKYKTNIYFKAPRKLCYSFEFEINKEKRIWTYRNVKIQEENKILLKKLYLLEIFFTVPMRFDIRTIKIQNFPINSKDMMRYLDDYNKSYQKRVKPQKEKFSKDDLSLLSGVYQITVVSNNHYIPQGYLREFKCEDKANYVYNFKLDEATLDETSGDIPVKIEKILTSSHFYSLGMELILKNIEDEFYIIRDKIKSSNNIKLSYKEKISTVRYLFAQYVRTPLERNRFINLAKSMLESVYLTKDKIKIEFNEIYVRKMIEDDMFQFLYPTKDNQNLELLNFYLKNEWKLIKAEHMDFFTSDNPIILYNNSYDSMVNQDYINSLKTPNSRIFGTRRPHGLMEPGIQFYFPITPKLCILIYNRQSGQHLLNPVEINEQILIQCYQNIISSNNRITNFLKRKLDQKKKERAKFVELHLYVQVKEY